MERTSPETTLATEIVRLQNNAEEAAKAFVLKPQAQEVNRASRGEALTSKEKLALSMTAEKVTQLAEDARRIREDASSPVLQKAADLKKLFQKTLQAIKPTL